MLGYKKESYYYLKEKYSEIEFLENPDYKTRNTISSFYHARDVLNDDFIISEGDLSIRDYKILENEISKTTYLYRPNQFQNNEWGFNIDFLTQKVIEVRKPEKEVFLDNNLYGLSFWKKEDLKTLINEIEKEYYNPMYKDSAYDELINNVISEIEIEVRPVSEKEIIEIDTLDELFEVDPTYKIFQSIDILKDVMGINRQDITRIYDNPGRSTNNYNYIVETSNEKFIVRIPGKGTEIFSNRFDEREGYLSLKGSGLIEKNYFLDPISGVKISKYYDGSRIIDTTNQKEMLVLMEKLRKLHNGDYTYKQDDVFDRIRRYDSYVARVGGRKYYEKEFVELQKEMLTIEDEFKKMLGIKPIHGDLSPNNVIVTKENEVVLIDLEFISMEDPYTDLATFSHDGNYTPEKTIELLEYYLGEKPSKLEIYKLLTLCSLVSVMWYSWAVFKMAVEESERIKFQEYRDLYLEYALIMKKSASKYKG